MTELEKLDIEKRKIEAIMVKLDGITELPAGLTLGETLKVIHTVNMYQGNLVARLDELLSEADRNMPVAEMEVDNER